MKLTLTACAIVVAVVTVTQIAIAHHSFSAEFDANKPITLTGKVTRLEWTNPHTWFYIDVTGDAGTVTNWAMEMGSPNGLMRAGWTRSSMKIGELVTVEGFLARDKPNVGNARVVTLTSTGQRLFAASSQGQ
jgi:hypothetical protein